MVKLLSLDCVALMVLLYGLMVIVSGQRGEPSCGQTCWGQQCIVSKNNCTSPCKCEQVFAPPDQGICASCRTEFCSCSTVPIADVPMRTCCTGTGLRCVEDKSTIKPAGSGEGICRK